ncbi:hypothetical protein ACHAQI_007264 [Fusarium lateritium]
MAYPSPASHELTDHEITVALNLTSDPNEVDKRRSRAARRIYRFVGDWPWVWLKDILPNMWSFFIIESLGTRVEHHDVDEVKTFLHDAVMQRDPKNHQLKREDVVCARHYYCSSQCDDSNTAADNDEQEDEQDDDDPLSKKGDATPGMDKSPKHLPRGVKRRWLTKHVYVAPKFEIEEVNDYRTLLKAAHPHARNNRSDSAKYSSSPRRTAAKDGTSTALVEPSMATSTSSSIGQILQIIRKVTSASDKKVADNKSAISTAREATAKDQQPAVDHFNAFLANSIKSLAESLEEAKSAHKATEEGQAAFESNLVAMNMDEEVAKVVRKNYLAKLTASQSKIANIEKQIETKKYAQAKVGAHRAESQPKIEQRELEAEKMEHKDDKNKLDKKFWTAVETMVLLGPKGLRDLCDLIESKDISLDDMISEVKKNKMKEDDDASESSSG